MAKVIETRTLADKTYTNPADSDYLMLAAVEKYLTDLQRLQDPKDINIQPSRFFVDLPHREYMTGQATNNTQETPLLFTSHGAKLLANLVLPGHFFKGLRQLSAMDQSGGEIATKAFQKFASALNGKRVMIRTIRTRHPEDHTRVVRAIRSCHSTKYAAYSNLQFVQDLRHSLDDKGFKNLPVLSWMLTDERMRVRFCAMDDPHSAIAAAVGGTGNHPFLAGEPMPMFEVHNSEVGMRRIVVRAGVFLADKDVFIGAYGLGAEANWTHRGNIGRIRNQLSGTVEDIIQEAEDVCEAYRQAGEIEIEDAYAFLNAEIEQHVSANVAKEITETLASQVAVKNLAQPAAGSALQAALASLKTASLAEVCEAVATVAKQKDLAKQYDLEKLAATILHRGRKTLK
jgi:hypothetical protein